MTTKITIIKNPKSSMFQISLQTLPYPPSYFISTSLSKFILHISEMSIPYSTIYSLVILIQRQKEGPHSRQPIFNLLAETTQHKFFHVLLFHLFLTIATSICSSFPLSIEYVSLPFSRVEPSSLRSPESSSPPGR